MKHLKFPFDDTITIKIKNQRTTQKIECELASSEIEIYQSLCFRTKKDFTKPLILLFEDPTKQYFSKQGFKFPVVQVNIDAQNNLVKKVSLIPKTKNEKVQNIQSFAEFAMIILFPIKSLVVRDIITDKTRIEI